MSTKRIRIRPSQGGTGLTRKNDLATLIYDQGIKFSRIIPTGDVFIVVCLNDNDVDYLTSNNVVDLLAQKQFEVNIPPHLKAKKTVVLKRLDRDSTALPVEVLKDDLENRNPWMTIDELNKFTNMPNMLKIRMRDIKMAHKAVDQGICIGNFHLSPSQVEMEDYVQLTPCWACYSYDHNVRDCPDKSTKKCSECASLGHTFRDCTNKDNPKCLNCGGQHRTLASRCPIRKLKIKDLKEERDSKQKQFERDNRTYCAVAKLSKEIPKLKQPESPVLNLNSDLSFKAMVIIIHAHLANIATPGTFGATVKQLLIKNNLPQVILPDDAPSAQIFQMVSSFPGDNITINVNEPRTQAHAEESSTETDEEPEDDEMVVTHSQTETVPVPAPAQPVQRPPRPPPSPEAVRRRPTHQQPQGTGAVTRRVQTTHKPSTKVIHNLGLRLFASHDDRIPEQLAPRDLMHNISQGKIKYTYQESIVPERDLIRYLAEGRITTNHYPIETIENSIFKKIRPGLTKSPGDGDRGKYRAATYLKDKS